MMSNLPRFGEYAAAFELSLQDNDWARLEPYFAEHSTYAPGDGTQAIGRAGVIQALQDSVNKLERMCDSRELLGQPEFSEAGNTITLKYQLKYAKRGAPDFVLVGVETAEYIDGEIVRLEDVFEDPEKLLAWQGQL